MLDKHILSKRLTYETREDKFADAKRKIERRMQQGKPLEFTVVAIAHKNPNEYFAGGRKIPDLAEFSFIAHLNSIVQQIENCYPPGATFTVITEGAYYFNYGKLFDVTEPEIEEYERVVKMISLAIAPERVQFTSLDDFASTVDNYHDVVEECLFNLKEKEYAHFVAAMDKSLSKVQRASGVTAEAVAKRYAALHLAKRKHVAGKSLIDHFLESHLGEDYIYCSVTKSEAANSVTIDPRALYKSPFLLPQHGVGVLVGGDHVEVLPFEELKQKKRVRGIYTPEFGETPFGFAI